jgi:hypothetical protein
LCAGEFRGPHYYWSLDIERLIPPERPEEYVDNGKRQRNNLEFRDREVLVYTSEALCCEPQTLSQYAFAQRISFALVHYFRCIDLSYGLL